MEIGTCLHPEGRIQEEGDGAWEGGGLRGVLSASGFPAGRAPLGPGPVHTEGPQHPEGAARGGAGGTPEGAEEVSHLEGRPSLAGRAEEPGAHSQGLGPTEAPRKIRKKPGFLPESCPDPSRCRSPTGWTPAKTKMRRQRQPQGLGRWVSGEGGPFPRPCPGLSPLSPCPPPLPQEMWRSSFLHHSNRCSCFHWPGASLMLLAVLLLLGCYGGQPAGRYVAPAEPLLPRALGLPSPASAKSAVPPRHPRGDGLLPQSCPHSRRLSCVGTLVPWLVGGGTRLDTLAGGLGGL